MRLSNSIPAARLGWLIPLLALVASTGCQQGSATGKRMIVLGIDGMDPQFLERHWGELPELNRLRTEGEFKRLGTTMPPQSPVAWSSFITGLDPAGHGVFDFIHRDPDTLLPFSSMAQSEQGGRRLTIGPYILPLTRGKIETHRRGTPFWKTLAGRGVPVTILRMPTDFPPVECDTHSLAGMGTPDLRGTFGTYAFFTTDHRRSQTKASGGEIFPIRLKNYTAVLRVPGPVNPLRTDEQSLHVDIRADVDPAAPAARFDIQGRRIILNQGEWSSWIPVRFRLIPALAGATGMLRIYAKQIRPHFEVYVSPINIDPSDPAMPISVPESYSRELAQTAGPFYTQGMPYDTGALRSGILSREEYLAHSREVSEQTLRLLYHALDRFDEGLLFFHFFGIDQDSHMLWGEHDDRLMETYRLADRMVGRVRRKAADATLIVMSDHGFAAFDRAVHLNTWLLREGFLALKQGEKTGDEELLANVDWSRTKAYVLGLNAIYVNQQFRERDGIVAEGEETETVLAAIREGLLDLRDPKTGQPVVHSVASPQASETETFDSAPDLLVGYYPGYRSSWQTALGAIPSDLIEDNTDEWRGDHCIDPEFVPGVLLSNRPSAMKNPRLPDLTVTILNEFGIDSAGHLEGASIYAKRSQ
jgi:predicted AlkP superfamily phosphohydrolase/phosphomutase